MLTGRALGENQASGLTGDRADTSAVVGEQGRIAFLVRRQVMACQWVDNLFDPLLILFAVARPGRVHGDERGVVLRPLGSLGRSSSSHVVPCTNRMPPQW